MKFEAIDSYLHKITPQSEEILKEMEDFAAEKGFPIIGPLVGRFLCQMAMVTKAKKILELGSGFGYSAYWFSLGMGGRGHIVMTDADSSNKERAFQYFIRGGLRTSIRFLPGDALELVAPLRVGYDIVLNDIDKVEYPETIDVAHRLLRPGGLFITDNLLWSGKVMDMRVKDPDTRGIRKFTKMLYSDDRFLTSLLPVRDGISVAVKR
ncbi:MAG: O-methyltransferase [candidate division Zixibacteria bacterium]